MEQDSEVFIGLDVAKTRHAVAVADDGRSGEVRYLGEIDSDPGSVRRMVARLGKPHRRLHFCYEAGPTGYGLYRQLTAMGHDCAVVAPSLIPKRPGDRVKTNRRDAIQLAKLLRAGELTPVWVPDETHEAIRELVLSRDAAVDAGILKRNVLYVARSRCVQRKTGSHGLGNQLCGSRMDIVGQKLCPARRTWYVNQHWIEIPHRSRQPHPASRSRSERTNT